MSVTKTAVLRANVSQFNANFRTAQRTAQNFKRNMQGVGATKMTGAGQSWEDMGRQVSNAGRNIATVSGIATAAATGMITSAVNTASAYEDAFADFRKVTDATKEEFKEIDSGLRDMAKRIPATYEEISGAAAAASRLGVESESIEKFAETALMMGTATNMGSEAAAEGLARFSNIMGTSFDDAEKLGSSIVELGNNSATTEDAIVQMSLRLAGAANNAGMAESDVFALSAAMQSVGIRAEMGGTAMSRTINQIGSDLARGGDDAERWASRAGMSASDFAKAYEDDALGAVTKVLQGLQDGTESGENMNAMLEELGITEMRQIDTLTRLAASTDDLVKYQEMGNDAFKEGTALSEEAELRYDTFSSKVQMLRNRFRNIAATIGGVFMDVLTNMIEAITPAIDRFSDWIEEMAEADDGTLELIATLIMLSTAALAVVTGIAFLGVAVGFLMTGFGSLMKLVGTLSTGFTAIAKKIPLLKKGFNGIVGAFKIFKKYAGIILIFVAAIVTAFIRLWQNNEEFRDNLRSIWDSVMSIFSTAWSAIQPILVALGYAFGVLVSFIEPFLEIAVAVTSAVLEWVAEFLEANQWILTLVAAFGTVFKIITKVVSIVMSAVKWFKYIVGIGKIVVGAVVAMAAPFMIVVAAIAALVGGLIYAYTQLEWFRDMVHTVMEAIKDAFFIALNWIIDLFKTIWQYAVDIWDDYFSELFEMVSAIFLNIYNSIKEILNNIISTFVDILDRILEFWNEYGQDMWDTVAKFFGKVNEEIVEVVSSVYDVIKEGFIQAYEFFKEIFSLIFLVVKERTELMLTFLSEGFKILLTIIGESLDFAFGIVKLGWDLILGIIEVAIDLILGIIRFFYSVFTGQWSEAFDVARETASNIMDRISGIVRGAVDTVLGLGSQFVDAGKNIIDSIVKGITSVAGKVKDTVSNIVGGVRDFLPFSPAKVGPLKDIHKLDFANPISDSIGDDERKIQNSLQQALRTPDPEGVDLANQVRSANRKADTTLRNQVNGEIQVGKQPAHINVAIGDQEFKRFTEDITNEQEWLEDVRNRSR